MLFYHSNQVESIVLHIEYLLQQHDCVILPGIGALIATRVAARYDETNGKFLPPHRQICFNSAVTNDDGLLVNSISRRSGLEFEEARSVMIRQLVALTRTLERDGEATLGKIGILRQEDEGNITFCPLTSGLSITEKMGMPVLNLKSPSDEEIIQSANHPAEAIDENTSDAPANEAPETTTTDNKKSPYYIIKVSKRAVRVAASVALILCAALTLRFAGIGTGEQAPSEASVMPVKVIAKAPLQIKEAILPSSAETKDTPDIRQNEITGDTYCLIVASFRNENEADTYLSQHTQSSYGLKKEFTGRIWHISAASSNDKETLLKLSHSDEFRSEYSESWVWKSK